ncbi:hypothetical protein EVAR_86184_1 [Eumeta japonica]|uniref:Uncharacterized protein n=1 Tax=Eumeta variegata TaxID=151549 RepID=A0A4C1UBU5_EUMVA|nr:hypothetical protein EVAR_86184_1 [Eumeta japonica]
MGRGTLQLRIAPFAGNSERYCTLAMSVLSRRDVYILNNDINISQVNTVFAKVCSKIVETESGEVEDGVTADSSPFPRPPRARLAGGPAPALTAVDVTTRSWSPARISRRVFSVVYIIILRYQSNYGIFARAVNDGHTDLNVERSYCFCRRSQRTVVIKKSADRGPAREGGSASSRARVLFREIVWKKKK